MKRKLFLSIALISALSSNAFSMEIVKGKLLDHKEWSTKGNLKATFKDIKIDKNKLSQLLSKHKNDIPAVISASSYMNKAEAVVGKETKLTGDTTVLIMNNTSEDREYTIKQDICTIDATGTIPACINNSSTILLSSGGFLYLNTQPSLLYTYLQAGRYNASASIDVQSNSDMTTIYSSSGYTDVIVTDPQNK